MRSARLLAALPLCALTLVGCAKAKSEEATQDKAASVITIPGTDRVRVRLTPEAVKRLDIQTGTLHDALVAPRPTATAGPSVAPAPAVAEADVPAAKAKKGAPAPAAPVAAPPPPAPPVPGATVRRVIPFAAVLYAPSGDAFTYVNVAPELYERTPITVEYVAGDDAVLTAGPPLGAVVVTVGGPELSGAEFGVGE